MLFGDHTFFFSLRVMNQFYFVCLWLHIGYLFVVLHINLLYSTLTYYLPTMGNPSGIHGMCEVQITI